MDAHGSKKLAQGLAAALVVGLVIPVGLAANVGAAEPECSEFDVEHWMMLAHERSDQIPVSQFIYQTVLDDVPFVGTVSQRSWFNGIDAYVIDLGCVVSTTSWDFCVDDAAFDSDDLRLSEQDAEYEVAFYEDDGRTEIDQFNKHDTGASPEGSTDRVVCEDIPENSRYAVVYLDEGTLNGVQREQFLWGPFTSKFRFSMFEPGST